MMSPENIVVLFVVTYIRSKAWKQEKLAFQVQKLIGNYLLD